MANRHLRRLSNDEIHDRWKERFERVRLELTYLFSIRRKFHDIQEMFVANARLNAIGSQAWEWLLGLWGRDAVMAIRRELDDDTNTISLGAILDEMETRPDVLTRRRFLAPIPPDKPGLLRPNSEAFTKWGVVSPTSDLMDDYLDPVGIRADRLSLDAVAAPVLEYANRMVAHRTPIGTDGMTVGDIHAALDAMKPILKKYHVILDGRALVNVEASNVGDDWRDAFTFAWHDRAAP